MSEFDYGKCTKPFTSQDEAREFMRARAFDGWILARADGTFTAVCPTYPHGFYPDAVVVEAFPEGTVPGRAALPTVDEDGACCAA